MNTTAQKKESLTPNAQVSMRRAPSIKHQPRLKRYYFDVGLGSVCLSGADTGGAYCLLEVSLAPGIGARQDSGLQDRRRCRPLILR